MKNETILNKAIAKTEKNGFEYRKFLNHHDHPDRYNDHYIIFDLDFAKAFWGEEEICPACLKPYRLKYSECFCLWSSKPDTPIAWQYRLQQMILEEEPLKYLEQFL